MKIFGGSFCGVCGCVMASGFELITYTLRRAAQSQLPSHISLASPEIFLCVYSRYSRWLGVFYRIVTEFQAGAHTKLDYTVYGRPPENSKAARRTNNWYELRVLHEDELRDSREYVARLVDFVESRTGGLLKQRGGLQPGPQGPKVMRMLGRISCFILNIV